MKQNEKESKFESIRTESDNNTQISESSNFEIEDNSPIKDEKLNLKGLMYGVLGNLAFAANGPILRILLSRNEGFTPYEILYWTGLSMLVMNYFYCKYNDQHVLNVGPKYRKIIVFRSFLGFCAI